MCKKHLPTDAIKNKSVCCRYQADTAQEWIYFWRNVCVSLYFFFHMFMCPRQVVSCRRLGSGKRHKASHTQSHNCVGVKSKTCNLLQIAKCDKEIQLIRIRCRHMWLQLFCSISIFRSLAFLRLAICLLMSQQQHGIEDN